MKGSGICQIYCAHTREEQSVKSEMHISITSYGKCFLLLCIARKLVIKKESSVLHHLCHTT